MAADLHSVMREQRSKHCTTVEALYVLTRLLSLAPTTGWTFPKIDWSVNRKKKQLFQLVIENKMIRSMNEESSKEALTKIVGEGVGRDRRDRGANHPLS